MKHFGIVLLCSLALAAGACGGDDDDDTSSPGGSGGSGNGVGGGGGNGVGGEAETGGTGGGGSVNATHFGSCAKLDGSDCFDHSCTGDCADWKTDQEDDCKGDDDKAWSTDECPEGAVARCEIANATLGVVVLQNYYGEPPDNFETKCNMAGGKVLE